MIFLKQILLIQPYLLFKVNWLNFAHNRTIFANT